MTNRKSPAVAHFVLVVHILQRIICTVDEIDDDIFVFFHTKTTTNSSTHSNSTKQKEMETGVPTPLTPPTSSICIYSC